jgi:hypothetical protein
MANMMPGQIHASLLLLNVQITFLKGFYSQGISDGTTAFKKTAFDIMTLSITIKHGI